jgi:hypothetical protein
VIGLSFFIITVVIFLLGELGLNRHTTLAVGHPALASSLGIMTVIVFILYYRSLRDETGFVRLSITRDLSVLQRGARIRRALGQLFWALAIGAASTWYLLQLVAQYVPGDRSYVAGTVVAVHRNLNGRQSCRTRIDIQVGASGIMTPCYVAGPLRGDVALSPVLPPEGTHVVSVLNTSWFGTAVQGLQF